MATSLDDYKLVETLLDMGHNSCSSIEECHRILCRIDDVSATSVARVIGMFARTHSALHPAIVRKARLLYLNRDDGHNGLIGRDWNVDVFVRAVHEHDPLLDWGNVVAAFDHLEFVVFDRRGLYIVTTALTLGLRLQGKSRFPIEYIYGQWRNVESQLSYICQILDNQDIFSFNDHPYHSVPKDVLKVPPDFSKPEIATWLSMDLIEALLYIGNCGLMKEVLHLFQRPIDLCPDMISVALVSSKSPMSELKQKLLGHLLSGFFNGHPNSSIILYTAWHNPIHRQQMRQMLMQIMVVHCKESDGDNVKLVKVLDVAQDLKALSQLLDTRVLSYKIDLASLASRREYLNLDKWVEDKLISQGEQFISDCLMYLKRQFRITAAALQKSGSRPLEIPNAIFTVAKALSSYLQRGFETAMEKEICVTLSHCNTLTTCVKELNYKLLQSRTPVDPVPVLENSMSKMIIQNPVNNISQSVPHMSFNEVKKMQLKSCIRKYLVTCFKTMPMDPSNNVKEDVDKNFRSYFDGEMQHDSEKFLHLMRILKESDDSYDREVFYFMIRFLLEEYVHLLEYPEAEMEAYARVFGGIIQYGLLTGPATSMVFHCILDAFKAASPPHLFRFGVRALNCFKTMLNDHKQFAANLRSQPTFIQIPQQIRQYVIEAEQERISPPVVRGATPVTTPIPSTSSTPSNTVVTTATSAETAEVAKKVTEEPKVRQILANANLDTLLNALPVHGPIPPPTEFREYVCDMFNNLSLISYKPQTDEFRMKTDGILEHKIWLARYIVVKRVCNEVKFHQLYSAFLQYLNLKELTSEVLSETYRNIKVLLHSDKSSGMFSDRTLLKNLGHWLGSITLAWNRPILMIDMDLKSLLAEAYHKTKEDLLFVIPFVTSVLESCTKSKVFKPPNPWVMALIRVLAEIFKEGNLKINLKFEIEMRYRNFGLKVEDTVTHNFLNTSGTLDNIVHQLSPKKGNAEEKKERVKEIEMADESQHFHRLSPASREAKWKTYPTEGACSDSDTLALDCDLSFEPLECTLEDLEGYPEEELVPTERPVPRFHLDDLEVESLHLHVSVREDLKLLKLYPQLKRTVITCLRISIDSYVLAMARFLRASVETTRILVRKDHALDPDGSRFRACAHSMVKSLCLSLCHAQTYSTLERDIAYQLVRMFSDLVPQFEYLSEEELKNEIKLASETLARDNKDVTCCCIQKMLVAKAVQQIDEDLKKNYEAREKCRQENEEFCDKQVLTLQQEKMPEMLKLQVGGPEREKLAVYEYFERSCPGFVPSTEYPNLGPWLSTTPAVSKNEVKRTPKRRLFAPNGLTRSKKGSHELMEQQSSLKRLAQATEWLKCNATQLGERYPSIRGTIDFTPLLNALAMVQHDKASVSSSIQFAVKILLDMQSVDEVGRETKAETLSKITDVLCCLKDHCSEVQALIAYFFWSSPEKQRYCREVVDLLFLSDLVNLSELDRNIAFSMAEGANLPAVNFGMNLFQDYVLGDSVNAMANEMDFINTVYQLETIYNTKGEVVEGLSAFLDSVRIHVGSYAGFPDLITASIVSHFNMGMKLASECGNAENVEVMELLYGWLDVYQSKDNEKLPHPEDDETQKGHTNEDKSREFREMLRENDISTDDSMLLLVLQGTKRVVELCRGIIEGNCSVQTLYDLLTVRRSPRRIDVAPQKANRLVDAFASLISFLIRTNTKHQDPQSQIYLLCQILGVISSVAISDCETAKEKFNQLPYYTLLHALLEDFSYNKLHNDDQYAVLLSFWAAFRALRPANAPGFAVAWLQLISKPLFYFPILKHLQRKGWSMYARLVVELLKFTAPTLRSYKTNPVFNKFYEGVTRFFAFLHKSVPHFLSEFHHTFLSYIPYFYTQLRNLILSSSRYGEFPRVFGQFKNENVFSGYDSTLDIASNAACLIRPASFRKELDEYLCKRTPRIFVKRLSTRFSGDTDKYNVALLTAVVVYVGSQALKELVRIPSNALLKNHYDSSFSDIFLYLARTLDAEGKYLMLSAMADQLRYPSTSTYYFCWQLRNLYMLNQGDRIRERIMRVLIERLIGLGPHPWGVLHLLYVLFDTAVDEQDTFLQSDAIFEDVKKFLTKKRQQMLREQIQREQHGMAMILSARQV